MVAVLEEKPAIGKKTIAFSQGRLERGGGSQSLNVVLDCPLPCACCRAPSSSIAITPQPRRPFRLCEAALGARADCEQNKKK